VNPQAASFDPDFAIAGEDDIEPPPAPRRGRWRRGLAWVATLAVLGLATGVLAARHEPAFYRERATSPAPEAWEQAGRRLVTDVSALHADFVKAGSWEAAFTDEQINGWLATDLPRNHPELLPEGIAEPRIRFLPRRVEVGIRLGTPPLSAVAWGTAEIRLEEPNRVAITLDDARLGLLPVPRGPVLQELGRRLAKLGMVSSSRRIDGRSALMVYIPSTHDSGGTSYWLESLAIGTGDVAVAGRTRPATLPIGPTAGP